MKTQSRPLHGLRILDLTRLFPGPYLTLTLADLGAEVVKVEPPGGADWVRYLPPKVNDVSAVFAALNRNKRSLCLNLKNEAGQAAFLRLLQRYDIVVETFRPGVLERLGVGYEAMRAANAQVILCSITGYGQEGPLSQRAGHDANYMARSGALDLIGDEKSPLLPGIQAADLAGGSLFGAISLLAAVVRRQQSGVGAHIDVSMTDGASAFSIMAWAELLAGGK